MSKKADNFWLKKLLDYAISIDVSWLVIWGTIFTSFVVLDAFFQNAFRGQDLFWNLEVFNHALHIKIISNGTFIGVTVLKYLGIILGVVYARKKFPDDYLLQIALILTFLADTLLMLDNVSISGVLVFCFAQYFHIARFAGTSPKIFLFWTMLIVLALIFGQQHGIPDIYVLGAIYGSNLLGNILLTHRWWKRSKLGYVAAPVNDKEALMSTNNLRYIKKTAPRKIREDIKIVKKFKKRYINLPKELKEREIVASTCAFYGFVLFACCDLNVAISFLSTQGIIPLWAYVPANFFAWFFYYPSQVLISNSSVIIGKTKKTQEN